MHLRSERGVTLTELTVVTVLASIVMLGLVGFYMSSQATWLDASTQALTQREATLLLGEITKQVQGATSVTIGATNPERCTLTLIRPGGAQHMFFWQDDSVFTESDSTGARPAVAASTVEKFEVDSNDTLVFVRNLQLRSSMGRSIQMSSNIRIYNR